MLLSQLSLPLSVESNMKSHDDSEPCVRFQNTLLQQFLTELVQAKHRHKREATRER